MKSLLKAWDGKIAASSSALIGPIRHGEIKRLLSLLIVYIIVIVLMAEDGWWFLLSGHEELAISISQDTPPRPSAYRRIHHPYH